MTKQRAAILTALRKAPGHYTAEEIFHMAQTEYPAISRATVYNNLSTLVSDHVLYRIQGCGTSDIYDTTVHPHAHLFCPRCGKVEDISLPHLTEDIREAIGEPNVYFELKIHRLCPHCHG